MAINDSREQEYKLALQKIGQGSQQDGIKALINLGLKYSDWGQPLYALVELALNNVIPTKQSEIKEWLNQIANSSYSREPTALYLLAWNQERQQDLVSANSILQKCLEMQADFKPALQLLATIKLKEESWLEAELLLREQLVYAPTQSHLLINLSIALMRQNKLQEALTNAKEAMIYTRPEQESSININIGSILQELGRRYEAKIHYKKALKLNPQSLNAQRNLGVIAMQNKDLKTAETIFRNILEREPSNIEVSLNLAGVLFLQEKYEEGWVYYEKRLDSKSNIMDIPKNLVRWNGKKIDGVILLIHEQGLGDTFQFIRYAKLLKEIGIHCDFYGPKNIHSIIKGSNLVRKCYEVGEKTSTDVKAWVAMMSLVSILKAHSKNIFTSGEPYISIDPLKKKYWQRILGKTQKLRIALHWQGNPTHEFTISRGRSFPLMALSPLLDLDNIELISLQKGPGSEQAASDSFKCKWHISQPQINQTWGFDDTAAILGCCDLLISSDSGLAHLAGATGTEVWLILPWLAEWRWGLSGTDTHWYNNHRIFRQNQEGNWTGCINTIKMLLADKI